MIERVDRCSTLESEKNTSGRMDVRADSSGCNDGTRKTRHFVFHLPSTFSQQCFSSSLNLISHQCSAHCPVGSSIFFTIRSSLLRKCAFEYLLSCRNDFSKQGERSAKLFSSTSTVHRSGNRWQTVRPSVSIVGPGHWKTSNRLEQSFHSTPLHAHRGNKQMQEHMEKDGPKQMRRNLSQRFARRRRKRGESCRCLPTDGHEGLVEILPQRRPFPRLLVRQGKSRSTMLSPSVRRA